MEVVEAVQYQLVPLQILLVVLEHQVLLLLNTKEPPCQTMRL
jgi:hypothetical protein